MKPPPRRGGQLRYSGEALLPRPPGRRGGAGALLFVALVLGALLLSFTAARPLAAEALAQFAEERPGLLRNAAVREVIRSTLSVDADAPAATAGQGQNFVVGKGDTAGPVARRLASEGVVSRAIVFLLALYEQGSEDALQAGTYRISPAMRPSDLARLFQRAPGEQLVLRVIEGWRLTEIAAEVQRRFPRIGAGEFLGAAIAGRYEHEFLRGVRPDAPLEGFLFPDTYFFAPDVSAEEIVRTLLDTFALRAGGEVERAARERGTRPHDIVALASIVEREARARHESAVIASVFWNRLKLGMPLQADPTVQYALGSWRELTTEDLKLNSPYNTYRHTGLPPTPISSPGLTALRAAAEPATTDFLFFVAKRDGTGEHVFARTLEEHEANRVRYGNR